MALELTRTAFPGSSGATGLEEKSEPLIAALAAGSGQSAGRAGMFRTAVAACALAMTIAVFAIAPALALDIKLVDDADDKTTTIMLTGPLVAGDGLKVRSFIGKVATSKPMTAQLGLAGGNRSEAMSIGRFFHQTRIRTVIPAKARCISPCPLVLVGGSDSVTGQLSYLKYSSASLGFSGVISNYPEKAYTTADLDAAVARAQRDILDVADYLRDVDANINILRYYQSVLKPNETRYITNEQALDIGIAVMVEETGELLAPLKPRP